MRILKADPGETAETFSARMLAEAHVYQCTVLGEFNSYTFEARPGMDTFDVRREYEADAYRSYFGKEMPF